jgi:hypothetical protein
MVGLHKSVTVLMEKRTTYPTAVFFYLSSTPNTSTIDTETNMVLTFVELQKSIYWSSL